MTHRDGLTESRWPLVELITESLSSRRFTGIVGDADAGKSALVNAALGHVRQQGTVVRLDLDGAYSPNRLAWLWARELVAARMDPVAMSHFAALSPDMWPGSTRGQVVEATRRLGSDLVSLAESEAPPRGVGTPDAVERAVQATIDLATEDRVLLVLDHLEAWEASGLSMPDARKLLWQIRAPGQHKPKLHVAVCCRPPAQDLAADPDAAYHLDGRWLTVGYLTEVEVAQATEIPLGVCAEIVRRTGGHPEATLHVIDLLEDKRPEQVDRAVLIAREHSGDLARRYVQHARSAHRIGGHLLAAVARGRGPYEATRDMTSSTISEAMTRLHLSGLVRRGEARGSWRLADPRVEWVLANTLGREPVHHVRSITDYAPATDVARASQSENR